MWQPAHFWLLAACQLCTAGFSFPAFHFWLFPQTVCALLEAMNCFDPTLASKGNPLSCKIAHEFKDDLNDDGVRKGLPEYRKQHGISTQTAMT
jgi:hypothetical protein